MRGGVCKQTYMMNPNVPLFPRVPLGNQFKTMLPFSEKAYPQQPKQKAMQPKT